MARLMLAAMLAAMLLPAAAADAHTRKTHHPRASSVARRLSPARRERLGTIAAHDPLTLATAVAERYWQAVPCGGHIEILANRRLSAGLDPTTDAWVTFDSSLGVN